MSTRPNNVTKASAAWGSPPDWVLALALACDAHGVRGTAARLGLSPALVSLCIRHAHHGPYTHAEQRVRAGLMTAVRTCPVLGEITADHCLTEQRKPFTSANPLAVAVYRACRGCQHNQGKGENP